MDQHELTFVIPTYRLRDVGETVEQYDQHFWRNGHSVPIVVFDDSSPANQQKYFPLLEQTRTHNALFYVGPREKEQFLAYLNERLGDPRLEGLVRNLFRPSYGGNRNCTLMYTLGGHMVSSDDDMRPFALMEDSPESLQADEVCRGRLHKAGKNHSVHKSFDILAAFKDVLGKPVAEIPENYERGELLVDTAMDLETNATKGLSVENSLMLKHGTVADRAVVKIAQTFRSGTNDIDALDFVEMFLADETQIDPDALNDLYVLVNFRPVVTNRNWRMDCGVAGYDNTFGLPPFFPTRLRFEDYIYRLWVQTDGIVAAHVDAAQHHTRSGYMRNPPAAEIFNEEVSNLIKRKIRASVTRIDKLSVGFDYNGEVSAADAQDVLEKIVSLHTRALARGREGGDAGTRRGAPAVRRQPAQGVLRIRTRLLSAESRPHRRRRHQRDQRIHRALADVGRDQLLPEGPARSPATPRAEPESVTSTVRIAQVAPLNERVPPQLYGGTERVVSYLTEALVRLGHEVTLFASGDSETAARLVAGSPHALWRDRQVRETLPHHVFLMELVFRDAARFDVIHFHTDYVHFPLVRRHRCATVTTLHGMVHPHDLRALLDEYRDVPLVSISNNQRSSIPDANWQGTVYHGLPLDAFTYREQRGTYLVYLGRMSPEKRVDRAIEIARASGIPLKIAAKIYPEEQAYFDETLAPLIRDSAPLVEFVGEIGDRERDHLLGDAAAFLFPIEWPEPFGLVMIEALACGTPVIGWRRGSVPEVLEDGVTGYVVESVEEAVRAVGRIDRLSRAACRRAFERRFDAKRMAVDYVDVYRRVISRQAA